MLPTGLLLSVSCLFRIQAFKGPMPTPPYRLHLATPVWELNAQSAFIGVRSRDTRDTVASRVSRRVSRARSARATVRTLRGSGAVRGVSAQSNSPRRGRGFRGAPECRKSATAPTGNRGTARSAGESGVAPPVPPRTAAEVKDQSLAVGLGSFSLQADLTDSTGTAYSASYSFTIY